MTTKILKTVLLTPAGRIELLARCPHVTNLRRVIGNPAEVIGRQHDTGAYLLHFPGCRHHFSVARLSVQSETKQP